MKISFSKVEIEEAGKAWAVSQDGLLSDLMIHSLNNVYYVKSYSNSNWSTVEAFDSLAKAKAFCKSKLYK